MSKILKDKPVKEFPILEGIELMKIDPGEGQPTPERETTMNAFRRGQELLRKFLLVQKPPQTSLNSI